MPTSQPPIRIRQASTGRSFAALDPERRPEMVAEPVRTRVAPIQTRPAREVQIDWMRARLQRDSRSYEGGSSR